MSHERASKDPVAAGSEAAGGWGLRALLIVGILLLGALPPVVWWWSVSDVPTVNIREALTFFPDEVSAEGGAGETPADRWALVDVRERDAFEARHAEGAYSWTFEDVKACGSAGEVPESLRDRRLLVVCDVGVLSAEATRHLRNLGLDAYNVEGGMRTWFAAIAPRPAGEIPPVDPEDRDRPGITFREATAFEQFIAVQAGFTIKPIYMLLSLALIWVLRRERAADLTALRWSMVFFLLGEVFCYLNYFLYGNYSHLVEYLHSYGMVLAAGFGAYAFFEGADHRVLHFSASRERCAATTLCRPCAKHTNAPCALKRLFHFLIPAAMVLAVLPLTVEPQAVCYDTRIWGIPYNYHHPLVYQFYEVRACPLLTLLLAGVSWLVLLVKRNEPVAWAKVWFAGALGFLVFSVFRLLVFAPFTGELVWFEVWEEVTELLGVAAIAVVLWAFRKGLWPDQRKGRDA